MPKIFNSVDPLEVVVAAPNCEIVVAVGPNCGMVFEPNVGVERPNMFDCVVLRVLGLNNDTVEVVAANGDVPVGGTGPNVELITLELVPNIVDFTGVLVFIVAKVDMVGLNRVDVVTVFEPKVEDVGVPKDEVVTGGLVLKLGTAKDDVLLKDGIVAGAMAPSDVVVAGKVPNDCTVVALKMKDGPEVLVTKGEVLVSKGDTITPLSIPSFKDVLLTTLDVIEPKLNTGVVVARVVGPNTLLDVNEVVIGNGEVVFGVVNNGNVYGEELFSETPCLKPPASVVNGESELFVLVPGVTNIIFELDWVVPIEKTFTDEVVVRLVPNLNDSKVLFASL